MILKLAKYLAITALLTLTTISITLASEAKLYVLEFNIERSSTALLQAQELTDRAQFAKCEALKAKAEYLLSRVYSHDLEATEDRVVDLQAKSKSFCTIDKKQEVSYNVLPIAKAEVIVVQPLLVKNNTGADVNAKIKYFQTRAYTSGYTSEQVKWLVALIDHESAGSWNENIIGDYGKSKGIAQWYAGAGRIASKTFNEQTDQFLREFKPYMEKHTIEVAVGKWNAPAWDSNPRYVAKVKKAMLNYVIESEAV